MAMSTTPVDTNTPLVLLSGLAADARVFTPQKIAFPQMQCPRWLIPERSETINDYAGRLAETLTKVRALLAAHRLAESSLCIWQITSTPEP